MLKLNLRNVFILIALSLGIHIAHAQQKKSVIIGAETQRPNAILVLNPPDGNQGFMLPQLNSSQRLSIQPASPADDGLIVFDIDEKAFFYWKANQWVKGLGEESNEQLAYDATTNQLRLSNSSQYVDLSALKEIPDLAGNINKILSNDGQHLSWINIPAAISNIIAGKGLSKTTSANEVQLLINVDETTIAVNNANQVELKDNAITNAKMANGAVDVNNMIAGTPNTVLTTNSTGEVTWATAPASADNQDISLTGNQLNIERGATTIDLNSLVANGQVTGSLNSLTIVNDAVTTVHLADDAVTTAKISDNAVATDHIQSGAINTVLTTNATGDVTWATAPASADNQDISLTGNQLNIERGATTVDLNSLVANGQVTGPLNSLTIANDAVTTVHLADDAVTTAKIADNAVATDHIQSGAINTVLTTNATGDVIWATAPASADNQDISLTGNQLNIERGATTVDLNSLVANGQVTGSLNSLTIANDAVTTVHLADDAVTTAKMADNAVATQNIISGGNSKLLATDPTGTVQWIDRSSIVDTDDQNLSYDVTNKILSITDGTAVDLSSLSDLDKTTQTGVLIGVAGSINSIVGSSSGEVLKWNGTNWITEVPVDASVTNETISAIQLSANNLQITEAGTTHTQNLNALTLAGDVTGTINASKVEGLQGNPVNPASLTPADNGKVMIWNGTEWIAQTVAGVSSSDQFYSIDPADFQRLRNIDKKDKDNVVIFEGNSSFVTLYKKDEGNFIIAPVHLPHGAIVDLITLYYVDNDGGSINVNLYRKSISGGNEAVITSWTSSSASGSVRTNDFTPIIGRGTIDNSSYSYRIVAELTPTNDTSDANSATQRIYGIRVRYHL